MNRAVPVDLPDRPDAGLPEHLDVPRRQWQP